MEATSLQAIFEQYPDALNDRAKLASLLRDFFPMQRADVNVFLIAFDSGIITTINECILDEYLQNRLVKILVDDYSITREKAYNAVYSWIIAYGVGILGKSSSVQPQEKLTSYERCEIQADQTPSTPVHTNPTKLLTRSHSKEGKKYPKEYIVRKPEIESEVGIVSIDYTIIEGTYDLEVVGNVFISGVPFDTMLCLCVYDELDRLVYYGLDTQLGPNNKKGTYPFRYLIDILDNVKISKMVLFPFPNPVPV